jgi:hypothetical protein
MTNSSIEKALEETWRNKEKFYESNKHLTIREIIEKIEGKKFAEKKSVEKTNKEEMKI